jgi:hypothetical protein
MNVSCFTVHWHNAVSSYLFVIEWYLWRYTCWYVLFVNLWWFNQYLHLSTISCEIVDFIRILSKWGDCIVSMHCKTGYVHIPCNIRWCRYNMFKTGIQIIHINTCSVKGITQLQINTLAYLMKTTINCLVKFNQKCSERQFVRLNGWNGAFYLFI